MTYYQSPMFFVEPLVAVTHALCDELFLAYVFILVMLCRDCPVRIVESLHKSGQHPLTTVINWIYQLH
jgi:hypothetical protein